MRVQSISLVNFRSFKELGPIHIGPMATIVGKNDVGKSNLLRALDLFFASKSTATDDDIHAGCEEDIIIEAGLSDFPTEIELEDGVKTTFSEEQLTDQEGLLRIRKVFPVGNLSKPIITLIVNDFQDEDFARLCTLKEAELNKRFEALGMDAQKSGRGITNKSKRDAIRDIARKRNVPLGKMEIELSAKDGLWQVIQRMLPELTLFPVDTKLGVSETTFQSQFRPIVKEAATGEAVSKAREDFTKAIFEKLQVEVGLMHGQLARYTDAFVSLRAVPEFAWDKAVSFDIKGVDSQGVEQSLERRGSGLRRLLMVAFFQYLSDKRTQGGNYIFAIEEPENCLHPGLQRELVESLRELTTIGYQVIVTSHSPVFAGASAMEDLVLVTRESGVASVVEHPELSPAKVAEELGIEPADQITGYSACVFVEGPDDEIFFKKVSKILGEASLVAGDFDSKNIGFVLCGGDCLKHWISRRAMKRLNKRFAVIVDSDRQAPDAMIPGRKTNWKRSVEQDGGLFFILRKREIENYLHKDAIQRHGVEIKDYDDFSDMKSLFGKKIVKAVHEMTVEEILECDRYKDDRSERHELMEIVEQILSLV